MSSQPPHVDELRDPAEFAPLTADWARLLTQTEPAGFFQSAPWLSVFAASLSPPERMRVLALRENGALCGLLPLAVLHQRNRLGRMRVLSWPLCGWGSFYGPIGPHPQRTLLAGLEHVRRSAADHDLVEFCSVPDGLKAKLLEGDALSEAGWSLQADRWSRVPLVRLKQGWDAYWSSRTSRHRNNLRRSARLLTGLGEIRHERYRPRGTSQGDDDPRWDLYADCLTVAGQSWQALALHGNTMTHDGVREFLRRAHTAAVGAGALDLNLLYVGGRPLAFAYNYHFAGQVSGLRMGFDASASRDGAGSVLMWRMLEDSAARGDDCVDLGAGYLQCKQHWFNETVDTWRLVHYPAGSMKAQLLRLKRAAQRRLRGDQEPALRDATK